MSAAILPFRDTTQNKMRRSLNSLAGLYIDIAGYCSYVYQRETVGLSVEDCKTIMINSWSDERIEAVEAIYQKELRE